MLLKKIVLAEDDDSIAHMIAMTLGDAGFLCLRARDGEDAMRLVKREAPDLLVLDVMMPKLDGMEVCRRLKADVLYSRVPVLMLTALGGVDNTIKGLDAGADDYMAKPFDLRELAARVKALVRASKRERDRNPTTNLPGAMAVEEHVDGVLKRRADDAVLYLDVDHFEDFADAFGFTRADAVTAELGAFILDLSRADGEGAAFVGHVGGDDFVVVAAASGAEALAKTLIQAFDERVAGWYAGTSASETMATRMTVSIAVVPVQKTGAKTTDELSKFLAQAKRASKRRDGSNYVIWDGE